MTKEIVEAVHALEQERTIDPETGEMREPEEPELDPEKLAEYAEIHRSNLVGD